MRSTHSNQWDKKPTASPYRTHCRRLENLERPVGVEAGRVAAVPHHELSVAAGVVEAALRGPDVEVGIVALGRGEVAVLLLDLRFSISRRGFQRDPVLPDTFFDTARSFLINKSYESGNLRSGFTP